MVFTRWLMGYLALLFLVAGPAFAQETDSLTGAEENPVVVTPAADAPARDTTAHGWEEAWTIELSRGVGTPPVWVDSLLLVASLDRNVHLVALGEEKARVVWDENFDGGFEASPLVTPNRIYLPETRRGKRLVALDRRTREEIWTAEAGDLAAEPILRGELVLTVSSDGDAAAWGPNGTRRWLTELETRVVAAPVLLGDAMVVAASDGRLFALDPDTGEIRRETDPDAGMIWGDPVATPGSADRALYATLEGQLLSVGPDLEVTDRRSFPSEFYAGPVVDGDRVYLIGHEGTAWAYDWAEAEVSWTEEVGGVFRATPAVGQRFVAFGNLAGTLYLLERASGELLWHTRLDGAITAAPTVVGDDLFPATERGTLYRFRPTG